MVDAVEGRMSAGPVQNPMMSAGDELADNLTETGKAAVGVGKDLAADALGMEHSDPRGFTVTGGLPYYGQFACSAGALVRMVELLREDREAFGLVTGNGAQPDASACRQASDSLS